MNNSHTVPHADSHPVSAEMLFEHAAFMRQVFLRSLQDALDSDETTHTCAFACALLSVSLSKFMNVDVAFQGGGGSDGGYVDSNGVVHGHYWLKTTCRQTRQTWIVDITADQFGGPPVLVQKIADSLFVYVPGDQRTVDEGMGEVLIQLGV